MFYKYLPKILKTDRQIFLTWLQFFTWQSQNLLTYHKIY